MNLTYSERHPHGEAREVYLKAKEPTLAGTDLAEWVDRSQGFSLAHLKEMIIAVRCFDQPLDAVVRRLEEMHERRVTSEDSPDKMPIGFARNAA